MLCCRACEAAGPRPQSNPGAQLRGRGQHHLCRVLGDRGIALFLVISSAFGLLLSWWYVAQSRLAPHTRHLAKSAVEARSLVVVGFTFMAAGLLSSGVDYLTRVSIIRELGLGTVGLYQATWTLGSYYVTFVTGAMAPPISSPA